MLVLALDTTTRGGSCALLENDAIVREQAGDASRPHAVRLPRELMTLLQEARRSLEEVDLYAVAVGPGSFTGLRVGIATMQGLAFAAGKPLIGASTLDALELVGRATAPHPHPTTQASWGPRDRAGAMGIPPHGAPGEPETVRPTIERIATWVDAWRGEVYAAAYENGREVEPPIVEKPEALLGRLDDRPTLFIGDGAGTYADLIRATLPSAEVAEPALPLLGVAVARLAAAAARAGDRPPPHAIRALYVRRPDAELARDARVER